jgi:hypothetical protein
MATITTGKQKVSPIKRGMIGYEVEEGVAVGDKGQL